MKLNIHANVRYAFLQVFLPCKRFLIFVKWSQNSWKSAVFREKLLTVLEFAAACSAACRRAQIRERVDATKTGANSDSSLSWTLSQFQPHLQEIQECTSPPRKKSR